VTDRDTARLALDASADLHRRVAADRAETVAEAARTMRAALDRGGTVFFFGNGGSATDAQHAAEELVGRFSREVVRTGLRAVALTADSAVLTAVANDFGYAEVFARQVEALGRKGDVAVGITTSGASANVNHALARARELGLATVALTGRDGGETGRLVDVHVNVPHDEPARVQEVHRTILHVLCGLIEKGKGQRAQGKGKSEGKGRRAQGKGKTRAT
jgi:D-sedoheptulose 7-phosphate isomerase